MTKAGDNALREALSHRQAEIILGRGLTNIRADNYDQAMRTADERWRLLKEDFATQPSASAPAAEPWISVEERLPPLGVLVLAMTKTGALSVFCREDGGDDGWLWAQQTWAWNIAAPEGIEADDDYDVTHWMPLPPPPGTAISLPSKAAGQDEQEPSAAPGEQERGS